MILGSHKEKEIKRVSACLFASSQRLQGCFFFFFQVKYKSTGVGVQMFYFNPVTKG